MSPSFALRRAVAASRAAQLRRFADENAERGLLHFAALDLAAADRAQAEANAYSLAMRAAALSEVRA
jgi:hypothetical protein